MALRGYVWLLLAAVAMANAGCLAATAGAVGAAGVGYAYYRGKVTRDFQANYEDVRAAAYSTFAALGMPVVGEERIASTGSISGLTGVGDKVQLSIETAPTPIPADGPRTTVGVRVGSFGDNILSERILHQIAIRLPHASSQTPANSNQWGPPAGSSNNLEPAAHSTQTPEPPLSIPPTKP